MKKYHAIIHHRTQTTRNTVIFNMKCDNIGVSIVEAYKKFSKKRPKATRIDHIDIIEHKA